MYSNFVTMTVLEGRTLLLRKVVSMLARIIKMMVIVLGDFFMTRLKVVIFVQESLISIA